MKNYLLEVGTENLPVEFQSSLEKQLTELVSENLKNQKLDFESLKIFYTPRRIALIINNLSDRQPDEVKEVKGPPANVAFKDGIPTKAVEGFCRRLNISVDQLKTVPFDGVEYIVASVEEKGKHASEVLQILLPDIILGLKGSYFMRWEDLDVRFSRPIRWLTSIADDSPLEMEIANVKATNYSRGHRFLAPGKIQITSIDNYVDKLKEACVMVNPVERLENIKNQIEQTALQAGGTVVPNKKLLMTVNNLVEWPVAALGTFDEEYLRLPVELITTVMSAHQKYFAVYNKEKTGLLNYFICVNNKNGSNTENIIKGNQRVLRARLEDAAFYYNEDSKTKLADKLESLKGVTFQKGLGNMLDKSQRIKEITALVSDQLGYSSSEKQHATRAAELCKADLTTFMVREFTELEGIMGKVYALNDGEAKESAAGIGEHYLPRSADDVMPASKAGIAVSIADKIDTIVSVFSIGKSPTGSADPLGLRRAALGVILMTINKKLSINISDLIEISCDLLGEIKHQNADELIRQVKEFIIQRLRIYLQELKYRYDVVEAVINTGDPLSNLNDIMARVDIVNRIVKDADYTAFHESSNRILRIIKGQNVNDIVDQSLFSADIEKEFYSSLEAIDTEGLSYEILVKKLRELTPVVEKFFDDVLVMDKDEKIKNNRLSLVKIADNKYKKLADFSYIVN
jgi:glycyl-tRNA synthetase beta chain